MTPQKKMWLNKNRRDARAAKKKKKKKRQKQNREHTHTHTHKKREAGEAAKKQHILSTQTETDPRTPLAQRQAVHRAYKALPQDPEKFAASVEGLHDAASPRRKKALERRGLVAENASWHLYAPGCGQLKEQKK